MLGRVHSMKPKTDGTKTSTSALLTGLLDKRDQLKIYLAAEQGQRQFPGVGSDREEMNTRPTKRSFWLFKGEFGFGTAMMRKPKC